MPQSKKWMVWIGGVLLALVLLYFAAYLKSGEPMQCLWRGDAPHELYRDGVKDPIAPIDGSPHMS